MNKLSILQMFGFIDGHELIRKLCSSRNVVLGNEDVTELAACVSIHHGHHI